MARIVCVRACEQNLSVHCVLDVSFVCSVFSVDYNDELDVLVSGSADFMVKVWALSAGVCLNTLTGHTEWVTKVSVCFLKINSAPHCQ